MLSTSLRMDRRQFVLAGLSAGGAALLSGCANTLRGASDNAQSHLSTQKLPKSFGGFGSICSRFGVSADGRLLRRYLR